MQRYLNTVSSRSGIPLQGIQVTVKLLNGTLASLFSDAAGTITLTNPVVTDANGLFAFYAEAGRYNLTISGAGITTVVIGDVVLFDMSDVMSGWGTPTGTLSRATFDQSTVTLPQLAQRVAQLILDLQNKGF